MLRNKHTNNKQLLLLLKLMKRRWLIPLVFIARCYTMKSYITHNHIQKSSRKFALSAEIYYEVNMKIKTKLIFSIHI